MARYTPPHQGKFGQIIDVLVLLILIIGALRVPLWLDLAGGAKTPAPFNPTATWADLGQDTPEKIAAYNALGFDNPDNEALQNIITARYDYTINYLELMVMIIVVIGYFFLIIKFSGEEYKEVIAEKFGDRK
ncbi:MAG: hypothetical protein U1E16_01185 [Hyphomicrobiales bacterium]|uniref:hypothetical protein n=1 Tax=Aestuariivirga sp. TaxID=2650926 RepID=UPI0035B4E38F